MTDCTVTQDGAQVLHTTQSYNTYGQTTGQSWVLDGTTYAQKYTYDTAKNAIPDGLLTSMTTGMGDSLSFSYDALGRLTGVGGKTGLVLRLRRRDRRRHHADRPIQQLLRGQGADQQQLHLQRRREHHGGDHRRQDMALHL